MGDIRVGHVVFLLVMTRNTCTNRVDAFGGMVYCHPFQRRYAFNDAWNRLVNMIGKGEPLGSEPPAMVAAVGVPRHPRWTCTAFPRDTFVTWGGQPREAIWTHPGTAGLSSPKRWDYQRGGRVDQLHVAASQL